MNKGHQESRRIVVVTLAACPAHVDPRGLLDHSGVTCAAAAASKATGRLKQHDRHRLETTQVLFFELLSSRKEETLWL